MNQHTCEMIAQEVRRILGDKVSDETYPIMRDELMETFGEIVAELVRIAPEKKELIFDLSDLLRQEDALYSPTAAYEAGARSQEAECRTAFKEYVQEVVLSPKATELFSQRDAIFYELIKLLGETHGLVTDFLENYRTCNNIISANIDVFFEMGLSSRQ